MTAPVATAEMFERWRALGFSDAALERMLTIDARTFEHSCDGSCDPHHEGRAELEALEAVRAHLLDTFTTVEAARTWLHADSRYLDGLKPADVLRAGRLDRVEAALNALDLGVFV